MKKHLRFLLTAVFTFASTIVLEQMTSQWVILPSIWIPRVMPM